MARPIQRFASGQEPLPMEPWVSREAAVPRLADVSGRVNLSVVVPAFNEEDRVFENLREIARTVGSFCPSWEILLVDDGSRDETMAQARRAQAEIPALRLLSSPTHHGKGFALRSGASEASGELVVFLDADLELHPRQIPILQRALQRDGADVVVGSKQVYDAAHRFPIIRRVLSRCYAALARLLFHLPVRDTQSGLKLFRRCVLRDALPAVRSTGFAFDLELLVQAHRMGFRLAEVPVAARFLRASNRLTIRDVARIWADTLGLCWRARVAARANRARGTNTTFSDRNA